MAGPPHDATLAADPVAASAVYPRGSRVNEAGQLEIGGCDAVELAREFGTPAYVYATDDIRARAREYTDALASHDVDCEVLFASKAAPITAICEILREEGLSIDVASAGELHIALKAGFDPARIYMHGNNKSPEELQLAFDAGIGTVVVDSLDEIELADSLLDRPQDVLIRLTPGIRPSTHSYVQTGQLDSKFGFGLAGGQATAAVEAIRASRHLQPRRPARPHRLADLRARAVRPGDRGARRVRRRATAQRAQRRRRPRDRLPGRRRAAVDRRVRRREGRGDPAALRSRCRRSCSSRGARSSGNAGVTLYTVGTVKEIPGVRTYVAVDGGMSDNLRPMLYGSRYEALIADRAAGPRVPPGDDRRQALRVRRRADRGVAARRPAHRATSS